MNKDIEEIIKNARIRIDITDDDRLAMIDSSKLSALCDEIERQNDQALADKFAGLAMQVLLRDGDTPLAKIAASSYYISNTMMEARKLNMEKD